MPSPLANRFLHLQFQPDFESFKVYALATNVQEQIIAFLSFRTTLLHSPRSWVMASHLHEANLDISPAVGSETTAEFAAYIQLYENLPDLMTIIDGFGDKIPFPN